MSPLIDLSAVDTRYQEIAYREIRTRGEKMKNTDQAVICRFKLPAKEMI